MPTTREEHDSLGPVTLPADALYGAQTARAIHNFPISGMRAHPQLIRAIAMVKMAAAGANRSLGLLNEAQSDSIIAAAEEIVNGYHHDHFPVDVFQAGAGVSFHMNANEVIANRANQILGAPSAATPSSTPTTRSTTASPPTTSSPPPCASVPCSRSKTSTPS